MNRRSVWGRRVLLVAFVVLVCQQAWRHGRDYVFVDQFAVVEPGRIFRGAWQQTWPMRRLVRDHHIKTVVALAHTPEHPLAVREKALSREMGFRWVHIPIVDDRSTMDGQGLDDLLEQAAAVLADPKNQPVYFHCHHGLNRASMVQIAYRTLYCGWTLEQANEEVARTFRLKEETHGPDYRYMKTFYEQRVLPLRRAQAAAGINASARQ
jgi:protein-tyrosine phosphatase